MLSTASLPLQIPDIHDLPIDFDDLSGRVKKVASDGQRKALDLASEGQRRALDLAGKAPFVPQKKRRRLSLAWPLLAVLAGLGLYMVVRSRRTRAADVGQREPSGAYARS